MVERVWDKRQLWFVGLFALLWAGVLAWRLQVEPFAWTFTHDAGEYSAGAIHLVQDGMYSLDGIVPTFEREPGQSLFLAMIYAVFGIQNRIAVFVVQGLLYCIASLVFVRELMQWTSHRAALFACALLCTLPSGFHVIFSLNREALALSLFLLFAAALLAMQRRPTMWHAAASGALLGLLIVTYMPLLLLPVCIVPVLLVWRVPLPRIGMLLLCASVPVIVWAGRNQLLVGRPAVSGTFRPAVTWYVRGKQAQHLRGAEPFLCLWSEYISRDWSGRSEYCSFNGVKNTRWPQGATAPEEHLPAGQEGKNLIKQYLPWYLWFSVFEIVELHIPFVDSWGMPYNGLAALSSFMLYCGALLAIPSFNKKYLWVFLAVIAYVIGVFTLTDATPRYLMPAVFCYVVLAAIGYDWALTRFALWRR